VLRRGEVPLDQRVQKLPLSLDDLQAVALQPAVVSALLAHLLTLASKALESFHERLNTCSYTRSARLHGSQRGKRVG
jgi:hypothetical protein